MFAIFFFFQAEDGIRDKLVTGVQTCALPISSIATSPAQSPGSVCCNSADTPAENESAAGSPLRSEEHTSELQSLAYLVCRLLLEKKKTKRKTTTHYSATQ